MRRSSFIRIAAGTLWYAPTARLASAQAFPSKPVVLISWSAAGSPIDLMEREIARIAPKYLGQPMVVEDKTGGGTANAIAYLFGQPADGYTMLGVTDSIVVALNTTLKNSFKLEQFDFIGQLVSDPFVIAVRTESPLKSWTDLVKATKTSNFTIGGAFAESNKSFFVRDMRTTVGIKCQYVPFDGSSSTMTAALGGHVDALCANVSAVAGYVQGGQMRVLAVSTADPVAALPGTPTFAALGYKTLTNAQWRGFAVRAGVPADARAKLVAFMKQISADTDFKSFCAKQKLPQDYADSVALSKLIATEETAVHKLLAEGIDSK